MPRAKKTKDEILKHLNKWPSRDGRRRGEVEGWEIIKSMLRQEIVASGMTLHELAMLAEVARPSVSAFVHGTTSLNFDVAARLMTVLGMSVVTFQGKSSRSRDA